MQTAHNTNDSEDARQKFYFDYPVNNKNLKIYVLFSKVD